MKKIFCILLLFVLIISMISCQNNNISHPSDRQSYITETEKDRVKEVEDLIYEASFATIVYVPDDQYESAKEKVEKAENAYNSLTQEEMNKLSEEKKSDLKKSRQELNFATAKKVTIEKAQNELKSELRNPSSLQINDIYAFSLYYDTNKNTPVAASVRIDFSAQNGFGGYERDRYAFYCKLNEDGSFRCEISVSEFNSICNQSGVERNFKY